MNAALVCLVALSAPAVTISVASLRAPQNSLAPTLVCANYVDDAAQSGSCLMASSAPTLGALYPLSAAFNVGATGNIGVGTVAPKSSVHVFGNDPTLSLTDANSFSDPNDRIQIRSQFENLMFQFFDASTASTKTLASIAQGSVLTVGSGVARAQISGDNAQMDLRSAGGVTGVSLRGNGTNDIRVMDAGGATAIHLTGANGRTKTKTLEITGGSDVAEGFDSSQSELQPGTVVALDESRPGEVVRAEHAYDRRVIGVVSGAGGVSPGLVLGQEGVLDGAVQVAMVGRVWVKCSAENGAIGVGDLLTTAATPGHAMKATDADRAFGCVIGKAASPLADGIGLVLTVVNLQ